MFITTLFPTTGNKMEKAIYNAYQILYRAIQDNVEDVNPSRREKKGRWVYPTLPTSLDTNYPRVTIKLSSFELRPSTAGGLFYVDKNKRSYGFQVNLTFGILLFINKEMMYPIELGGSVVKAKNELLLEYLCSNIYKTLYRLILNGYFRKNGFFVLPGSLSYNPATWEYDTSRLVSELSIVMNGFEELFEVVSDDNVIEVVNNLMNPV